MFVPEQKAWIFQSSNPVLRPGTFGGGPPDAERMTLQGTVNKTFLFLGLSAWGASWGWSRENFSLPMVALGAVAAVGLLFLTAFKKRWAPVTGSIYAFLQGVLLSFGAKALEKSHPGSILQGVLLTFAAMFCLLSLHKIRPVRFTGKLVRGIAIGTGAILLIYLMDLFLILRGVGMPYIHESGPAGIAFSLFALTMGALNLMLDFDFIQRGIETGAPKYLEWYGAFALTVTLVWLYTEILRLTRKLLER